MLSSSTQLGGADDGQLAAGERYCFRLEGAASARRHTMPWAAPTDEQRERVPHNGEAAALPPRGDYAFCCVVAAHRQAGMQGTSTVR